MTELHGCVLQIRYIVGLQSWSVNIHLGTDPGLGIAVFGDGLIIYASLPALVGASRDSDLVFADDDYPSGRIAAQTGKGFGS